MRYVISVPIRICIMNAVFDRVEQRILNMDYLSTKYSFNGIFEMYGLADQLWLVKECSMIEGTSYHQCL